MSSLRQKITELPGVLNTIILCLLVGTFCVYVVLVFSAYVIEWPARLRSAIAGTESFSVGLPCAAAAGYGVVALLLYAFPPKPDSQGTITLKFFGLEFSGPSGPITLWLCCFLAFVAAAKWFVE
jgi:hypothetical protein